MTHSDSTDKLTIITTHFNPDYDAVASMVAARKLYPGSLLVFPGGSEKNLRHFFIQSLIHTLAPAKLKDIDLKKVARLVVVDTRHPGRIGPVAQVLKNSGLEIHLYDHHPDHPQDLKGAIEVVEKVGATVTLLTEILGRHRIKLSSEEATMMAMGIYEDTGSFSFNSTTAKDYLAAASLLEQGADLTVISQLTVRELTSAQLTLLNELIGTAESRQAKGVNFVVAAAHAEEYVDDVAVLAHKMMEILGIPILFVLVEMEGKVQLVIRSRMGTIDAARVAREFGGGGHASAAAAVIRDLGLNEAKVQLEKVLTDFLGQFYLAKNIMVHPPICILASQTLSEAREIMVKYSINVLLVTDDNQRAIGFISEHNVSKALYHGLLNYQVSAFMNTEFLFVGPESNFSEIKNIIVDRKQRVLPVLENGKPVGVITRTDLLQVLAGDSDGAAGILPAAKKETNRRNLSSQMKEKLPLGIFETLKSMGQLADEMDIQLYAVGGFVRDMILRLPNNDIDLTMDGDIAAFVKAVEKNLKVLRIKTHPRFKSASIELADGYSIDISTTRLEYYEHPGALPIVQQGSIQLDLYRRDFTINSLALSLNSKNFGEVLDFYRGYQDIKDGYIRVLHNLSFVEDPTRAFRAVRFEARLKFRMSKMTASLLEGAVANNFLASLNRRRLLNELKLILSEDDPGPALERLQEFGLLKSIHPLLNLSPKHFDLFRQVRKVRDWLLLSFAEKADNVWLVYLMALTDGFKQELMEDLALSLSLKKADAALLTTERPYIAELFGKFKQLGKKQKPSQIYALFKKFSLPSILFIMAKAVDGELSRAGATYLSKLKQVKALLSGRDVMALGIPHGPVVHEVLAALKDARLDGLVQSRNDEEEFVRQNFTAGIVP